MTGHLNLTRMVDMQRASVTELKARLSQYLREVKRGGEVQVLERGVPIARLSPIHGSSPGEDRQRLIEAGIIRPGSGNTAQILDRSPLEIGITVSDAVIEDRADRS